MRVNRAVLGPFLVALVAMATGGWFTARTSTVTMASLETQPSVSWTV